MCRKNSASSRAKNMAADEKINLCNFLENLCLLYNINPQFQLKCMSIRLQWYGRQRFSVIFHSREENLSWTIFSNASKFHIPNSNALALQSETAAFLLLKLSGRRLRTGTFRMLFNLRRDRYLCAHRTKYVHDITW